MNEGIINQLIDDRYLIQERITAGGMAIVYKALDQQTNEIVALKLLQTSWAEHSDVIDRFVREANIMDGLKDHPHIVSYIGTGKYENRPYIAMDYIPGGSLSDLLKEVTHIKLQGTARLLHQIASALDYAHGKDVVHRDLKPGNILLIDDKHATLTDFGIARVLDHTQITVFGQMPGTPQYMSPEQASGLVDEIDRLSDIYSLGVIAYLLSTGRLPFAGSEPMAIINAHLVQDPEPPSKINPNLPEAVDAVLLKALAKKKVDRYQSARDFAIQYEEAIKTAPDIEVIIRVKKKLPTPVDGERRTHIFSGDAEVLTHYNTTSPIRRSSEGRRRGLLIFALPVVLGILVVGIVIGGNIFGNNDSGALLPEEEQTNSAQVEGTQIAQETRSVEQAEVARTQTQQAQEQISINVTQTTEAQIANRTATQETINQEATSNAQNENATALAATTTVQAATALAQQEIDLTRTQEYFRNVTVTAQIIIAQRAQQTQQAVETRNAQQTATSVARTATHVQATEVAQAIASTQATLTPTPLFYENDLAGVVTDLISLDTLRNSQVNCEIFVPIYIFIETQIDNDIRDFAVFDDLMDEESTLPFIYNTYCLDQETAEPLTDLVIFPSDDENNLSTRIVDLFLLLEDIDMRN